MPVPRDTLSQFVRVVLVQYGAVFAASAAGALFGADAAFAVMAGGLCMVVPNTMLLALVAVRQLAGKALPLALALGSELLKVIVIIALFVMMARLFPGLNWPGMIFGIVTGACSQFSLLMFK